MTEVDVQPTFRRLAHLILRAWPYYRPQLKHLVTYLLLNVLAGAIILVAGLIGNDLLNNKVLVGTPLQPMQATLLLLDDSYVVGAREDAESLTSEQRQTVRNRLLSWGLVGLLLLLASFSLGWYYMTWIYQRINQDLRLAMLAKAESLSLRFHDQARTGDAIYRIYQDSATITNVLQQLIVTPLRVLIWMLWGFTLLTLFSPWLGLLCILTVVPVTLLFIYFTPQIQKYSRIARRTNSDLTSRIQESFASIRVIKANRAEEAVIQRFEQDSKRALDAAFQFRLQVTLLALGVSTVAMAAVLGGEYLMAGWTISGTATYLGGVITLVGFATWNLGAYQSAAGTISQNSQQGFELAQLWGGAQDLMIGLERAYYLLDQEAEVTDVAQPLPFPVSVRQVAWHDVSFAYEQQKPILSRLNLTATAGSITAIVGPTGTGKSTLMALLLRLYDPDQGTITINDTPIDYIRIDDLRSHVAIALQQNVLFTTTIADNISYATSDKTRADIDAAAKISCAHEFIEALPLGYDTELGERGGKLSTGQRQRLTIARAILRDTPILVLDEPTASLDAVTEQRVLRNIAEWGKSRIVFIITHRLSTIKQASQIAFMHEGSIVELGDHDTLIGIPEGYYRRFVRAELKGYEALA
ncbi:MAG: ABC transporter ATP-binding protein [Proteobacteria bacterium]|nr:ABC transporter ATP-binding protein [Pseudomonadota bacterium]MBT6347835.1 ABC transporter ATP-binding protein [Pseudomonadota bacterium]